jgi:hypothetical protein
LAIAENCRLEAARPWFGKELAGLRCKEFREASWIAEVVPQGQIRPTLKQFDWN